MFRPLLVATLILAPALVFGAEPVKIKKPAHIFPVYAAKWDQAFAEYERQVSEEQVEHIKRLSGLTSDEQIRSEKEQFAFVLSGKRAAFKAAEAKIMEEQATWRIADTKQRRAEQRARSAQRAQQIQAANAAFWYQVNSANNAYHHSYGYRYPQHCNPQGGYYRQGIWLQINGF